MPRLTLFQVAQRAKSILTARATGGQARERDFTRLRQRVIAQRDIEDLIPDVLMTYRTLDEFWAFIKTEFPTYRERQQYLVAQFKPLLRELELRQSSTSAVLSTDALESCDSQHVRETWSKALSRVNTEPDGAVTAAKALLEAVCKHILDESETEYTERDDLPKLYSRAADQLKLSPDHQVDETIRAMMGSSQQVVNRVSALRNLVGDAHGKGKNSPKLGPHDDELAVNMAGAIASYMISCWESQQT